MNQNKIINFLKKIENLNSRDKISLFIGMISFLILINFTDFSAFKADITAVENQTEEKTEEIQEAENTEIKENTSEEIGKTSEEIEKTSEEVEKTSEEIEKTSEEIKTEDILKESKTEETNLEKEITEEEVTKLLDPESENLSTADKNTEQEAEIVISENPVLSENTEDLEIKNTEETGINNEEENKEISKEIENTGEDFLEVVDKNAETLAQLEKEENETSIEIISDIEKEETPKEDTKKIVESTTKTEETQNPTNELDKQIEAAIVEIQEIKKQKENENQTANITQEKIQNQTKSGGLPEDDFTVSGAETEAYNEMVRAKKEQAIVDKYEKMIAEQEAAKKDLADRLEMLENKLKNQEKVKTAEEIAQEKEELSQREIAKREAAEKLKVLEAEKAEKLKLENIEKEKKNLAIEKFNKDSDGDGLSDHIEKIIETNNKLIDTDGDGYSDLREIEKFFSPNSEGKLFSDISEKDRDKEKIISGVKKGLVFLRTGDKFLKDEEIYRNEAVKIIVSAMYPSEIYREDEFFEGVELYSDVSSSDDYARYLAVAIKHGILDGIIADNFEAYGTFTKAEFIKILINSTGKSPSSKKIKWIDTEYDNWFTPYFARAKEIGIINNEIYTRIFPLKKISRMEAVKYALKASKYSN